MKLLLIGLIMANGLSFAPDQPDKEKYTPERLYSFLVFADNYVKNKNLSTSEYNPNDEREFVLNTDDPSAMQMLVAIALAEHHDKGYSTGYSQNRVSKPNSNGSIDYGLWQINDFWENRLKKNFPELFDNGRDFVDNISNPFINAVAAIYVSGYVEGGGPNGLENWSTYKMVTPDSDFMMDAESIQTARSKGGDIISIGDFEEPKFSNKLLDRAYGQPVKESMEKEAAKFTELLNDFVTGTTLLSNKPKNIGYDKLRFEQMKQGK
tara:strand:+ start:3006 stop:3800 length:795 start_codon:yes stop_codon:yes gene_type:complete